MKNHFITILPAGYGHFKVITQHYGKEIQCITTDTRAIDAYNDDNERKSNRGKKELRAICIRANKKTI